MGIAVITGASSGIGHEFTLQVGRAKSVDRIYAVARRKERLLELQQQVETPIVPLALDLSDPAAMPELQTAIEKDGADISMLINCAGFAKFGDYGQVSTSDNLSMIDLNIRALVAITELCIPHMKKNACILQVASTAAFQPLPGMNVYAASKAFVLSYARALGEELAERGICVTALCPGWTKTEFFDVAEKNADKNAVHKMPFMTTPQFVAESALRAMKKRRSVCVPGIFNKAHFFFSKIIPDSTIMGIWELMK